MAIEGILTGNSPRSTGFSPNLQLNTKRRKRDERYQRKIDSYREGFFRIAGADNRQGVLDSLKRRAKKDSLARARYNAIVGDQRIEQPFEVTDLVKLSEPEAISSGLVESIKAVPERLGRGFGESFSLDTSLYNKSRQGEAELSESLTQLASKYARQLKDPKVSRERKSRIRKSLQGLRSQQDELFGRSTGRTDEIMEATDPVKGVAAIVELGILAAGGVGARVASSLGGRIAATAAEGAVAGGAVGLQQDDADVGDVLKSAAIGGALGGVIPAAVPAFNKFRSLNVPSIAETRLGSRAAETRTLQKIGSLKDQFVAKVVDNTNYIKKPFRGVNDSVTGRKVTEEIEDRITNVRQFAAKAQERLQENTSFQELRPLIGGDKKRYKELGSFINAKQNAINARKVADAPVTKAKNRLIAANEALDKAQTTKQRDIAKAQVKSATKNWEKVNAERSRKTIPRTPRGTADQEQAYHLLNQSTKDDVQYLFDNGVIDENKYNKWMSDPNYTRVQREVEEDFSKQYGNRGLVSGSTVSNQKLKGSTKKALDPFASYEDWQRRVTLEVERNNLAKYVRDQGVKYGKSNALDTTSVGVERVRQLYGEEGIRQKTLPVFENGMKELYTIDPRAARQLANAPDLELKAIANWVLLPSRVLRGGATSLNAAFALPNFIRDQVSSAIISKRLRSTHNPLAFWAGFKEAVAKPTGNAALRKLPGVADEVFKPSPLFKEYLSRNANMTSVDLARNLKVATRQAQENLGVKGESLLRRYENIISASEKATRYQNFIGTYKRAIKKGTPTEQALQEANAAARTNSINFSNRGEIAAFTKIFNPYFNAGVQGASTLGRALKTRPVGTGLKIGASILAPVASSTYYNLSDEERAEIYARIPEYERRDNLIMVLGGGRGYVKVPLPPGMREFAKPLRNFIESEYLGDRQGLLETAKNLFVDPFSPVGTTANEVISNTIPVAAKPPIELAMNRDLYTGRDIVPENLQGLPTEEQVFDSTPQIYRDIAKRFGVSPLQVRKVIAGYGAGGTEGALATFDKARGKESGGRSTVEQIVKRFYGTNPSESSNQVKSTFYETYTPLRSKKENISRRVTQAVKDNNMAEANRLAREINEEIEREKERLRSSYGRFESDLSVLFSQFDSLKFPLNGDSLTEASISSRRKQ